LFYLTVAAAVAVAVSTLFFETLIQQYTAWRLTRRLHDPVEVVRQEAAEGLVQLGSAATWWVIRATHDSDAGVRALSCSVLARTASDGAAEPAEALLAAVRDSDPSVRARALGQLETIVTRYTSPTGSSLRERALRSLGAALDDDSHQVRWAAVESLWNLGGSARSAVGALERTLDGPDKSLKPFAADAMLRIEPSTTRPHVVAAMGSLLADKSIRFEHSRLVRVLTAAQGEDATAAMLAPLLHHPDLETRIQAMNDLLLHCSGAKALRPMLIEALASDDGFLRDEAALYFLKHEPEMASKALDTLAGQIIDPRDGGHIPESLIQDLRRTSPKSLAVFARELVERMSRSPNSTSRVSAITALGEIGPDATMAIPTLLDASKSGDINLATSAVEALVKIDPKSAATRIPLLLDWVAAGHERTTRLTAMAALRDLGPAATDALPTLLELANEPDLPIAAGAIEAICRIDPARGTALKQNIENGLQDSRDE
jgi:HEAT repeat protein